MSSPTLAAATAAALLFAAPLARAQDDGDRDSRSRSELQERESTDWGLDWNREAEAWSDIERLDREDFDRDGLGSYHSSRDELKDQERDIEALRGEIDQFLLRASVRGAAMDEIIIPATGQVIRLGRARLVGDWAVRGFLSEQVTYDDNIYQIDDDVKDDLISETTAGFRVSRVGAQMVVDVTTAVTFEGFIDEPHLNAIDGYFRGGAQWNFGRGYFRIFDIYADRNDSIVVDVNVKTTATTINTVAYDRIRQKQNVAGAATGYRWPKLTSEVRYEVTTWEYDRVAEGMDANEHRLILHNEFPATPNLDLNLDLDVSTLEFEQNLNNDYDAYRASAGWNWLASEKVRTYGDVGYRVQDADQSGKIPEKADYSGPTWMVAARWNVTPKVDAVVMYSGDIYRSVGANYQLAQVLGTRFEWRFAPMWRLDLTSGGQFSDVSRGEDFHYRNHGARLGWFLNERFEAAMSWEYRRRASGIRNTDFENHQVSLQFTVFF